MNAGGHVAEHMDVDQSAEVRATTATGSPHKLPHQSRHQFEDIASGTDDATGEPNNERRSASGGRSRLEQHEVDDAADVEQPECELERDDLWQEFHRIGTEMIITRAGRCAFERFNTYDITIK